MSPTIGEIAEAAQRGASLEKYFLRTPPADEMNLAQEAGILDVLNSDGTFKLNVRDLYQTSEELGKGSLSLGLLYTMHISALGLVDASDVPEDVRQHMASLGKTNVFGAFFSGLWTRSSDLMSNRTDVDGEPFTEGGERHWRITGTKGAATNVNGADYAAVTFREADDDPDASFLGFIKLRDEEGNYAEGIAVQPTGQTLGARATQSDTVSLNNVVVPYDQVLGRIPQLVKYLLLDRAHTLWGCYTAAYLGNCKQLLAFLTETLEGRTTDVEECQQKVKEADETLKQAASLADNGQDAGAAALTLLRAKELVGEATAWIIYQICRNGSFHGLLWSGHPAQLTALLDGFMVNAQPPALKTILDIYEGKIQLPM